MKKNRKSQWTHRVLTLMLALVLLVQLVPLGAVYAKAAEEEETQTAEGTVQVSSPEQLLSGVPKGSIYELANDITLGAGQMIPEVAGVLDGKGHTVTLTDRVLANSVTGTIQNLTVTSDGPVTGVTQGWSTNGGSFAVSLTGGKLYNCISTATVAGLDEFNSDRIGGLVFRAEAGAELKNCVFAGKLQNGNKAGLAADASDISSPVTPSTFANCFYDNDNGKIKKAIGSGKDYHTEFLMEAKTADEMKTAAFAELLNKQNLGTGYIWQAVEGDFPKLVADTSGVQANLEELNAAIQEAESKVKEDYTPESWAVMQEALTKARATAAKEGVTQSEVNAAAQTLEEALTQLKKIRKPLPVELPKEEVVLISSADDFKQIPSDNTGKFYQLTQDIVIEGGFLARNLNGVFDGGGHTITLKTESLDGSPLFNQIKPTGVVQNLRVKVEGRYPNYNELAPYAEVLNGGMIVNCVSHVTGQHSAGFVMMMNDGIIANCLTMGHNRRGAFVHYQKSTDHVNTNGYSGGKLYNCYWAPSNSVENIQEIAPNNLIACRPAGDDELRSDQFIELLNSKKGEFGVTWGRDADGYPYLGEDLGNHVIDGSKNRYPVEFVSYNDEVLIVEDGRLELSPQMVTGNDRFAGTLQLKGAPEDSTITWSSEDRADREVIALYDNNRLHIFFSGGAVLTATEHKADGTEQLAAEIRVISESQKIEELRLVLDGKVVDKEIVVQGSENKTLDIQARYEGNSEFRSLPPYLAKMQPENGGHIFTSYNSATFHCEFPGTSNLTVATKNGDVSITVKVTSEYVPVQSVKPGISGIQKIHGRNSMGSGQFNDIPVGIVVEPGNASYKDRFTAESSNKEIAVFGTSGIVIPFKDGTVTFTIKLDDKGSIAEGSSEVQFVYANPLLRVTGPTEKVSLKVGQKQMLDLKFEGMNSQYAAVSEPELIWSYDKTGIVSISRPMTLMQVRDANTMDAGDWVASSHYEVKAMKSGTVTVTGTPVDTTGGAEPVSFTITVSGDDDNIPAFDISQFIADGKEAAIQHLTAKNSYSFGQEWNIYTMLRDGQTLPQDKLDQYYDSVAANVKNWDPTTKPTEIERTWLALSIMDQDITNVNGVNLVNMICNHPDLTRQGSNALIWALIALDLKDTPIPDGAAWTRERLVSELLTYQKEDGSFALEKKGSSGVDVTAMALQALVGYQEMDGVQESIERGVAYMAKAAEKNLDYGNSETISQVIIALSVLNRDLVQEPGFGDEVDNLMTVLSRYMVRGQGFEHVKGQGVNTMATVQAMQALCAYERFRNGESGYWDLLDTNPSVDPVDKVIEMIDRLPENITLKDIEAVRAARQAFDALTSAQQERVTNVAKLEAAEEAIRNMSQNEEAALEVMELIEAIGEVTLDSQKQIEAARAAYEKLTREQKELVANYAVLEAAEEALRIMQLPKVDTEKAYQTTGDYLEELAKKTPPVVNSVGGEWLILGLARSGREVPAGYYENVLAYVNENINQKEQLHRSKSTDNARVILALTAIGKDVTDVAGHNLLQGLSDMKYLKKQGINGPIWALIAYDCHNYEIPTVYEGGEQVTREGLIETILSAQLPDGGWALSGTNSDADMTAMALEALAPYYQSNEKVKTAADAAIQMLSKLQKSDGHFGSLDVTNSESSAQVIVAMTALGIDPNTDARFVKNTRSVVNALCDFYVDGGGFKHIVTEGRDGMATEQGYYALTALYRMMKGQTRLFDMTDVTIEKAIPFTDVAEDDWYYESVSYVYHHNLMKGVSDTTFAPENKMTRGQLVTVLYRMAGSPEVDGTTSFTDLRKDSYYEDAVVWAKRNGIANGITATTFGPGKWVTREQIATFFARYAAMKGADMEVSGDLTVFVDEQQVSTYAEKTMQWAVGTRLIQGVGNNILRPQGYATRAQAATMLQRLDVLLDD